MLSTIVEALVEVTELVLRMAPVEVDSGSEIEIDICTQIDIVTSVPADNSALAMMVWRVEPSPQPAKIVVGVGKNDADDVMVMYCELNVDEVIADATGAEEENIEELWNNVVMPDVVTEVAVLLADPESEVESVIGLVVRPLVGSSEASVVVSELRLGSWVAEKLIVSVELLSSEVVDGLVEVSSVGGDVLVKLVVIDGTLLLVDKSVDKSLGEEAVFPVVDETLMSDVERVGMDCASVGAELVDASKASELDVVEPKVAIVVVSVALDDGIDGGTENPDELGTGVVSDAAVVVEVTGTLSLVESNSVVVIVMISVCDVIDVETLLSLKVIVIEMVMDESDVATLMASVEVLVSGPAELKNSPVVVVVIDVVVNELELRIVTDVIIVRYEVGK